MNQPVDGSIEGLLEEYRTLMVGWRTDDPDASVKERRLSVVVTMLRRLGRLPTSPVLTATEQGRDELTPDEARQFLEEQVKTYLDMSVEEFRKRAHADALPDDPMVVHLALLAGVDLHSC